MSFKHRESEFAVPEDVIDVIVEVPTGSRNKYEYDHENHVMRLDRRLFTSTQYPADYGFVPDTLSEDGDPLDALIILDDPTFPGCYVEVRIVGIFFMTDEAGPDAKLICVVNGDPHRHGIQDIEDLPEHAKDEIAHFFKVYKDLEPGKSSNPGHFEGKDAALAELQASRDRYVPAGH